MNLTLPYSVLIEKVKAIGAVRAPAFKASTVSLHDLAGNHLPQVGPRLLNHSFIVLLVAAVAFVSGLNTAKMARAAAKSWEFDPFVARSLDSGKDFLLKPVLLSTIPGATDAPPAPTTAAASKPKLTITTYDVVGGDTLTGIAEKFGVSAETILSANNLDDADALGIGDKLVILPISGILHTVRSGDTLDAIAAKYQVTSRAIVESEFNNLAEPYLLSIGQKLVVPGGKMPVVVQPAVKIDLPPVSQAAQPAVAAQAAVRTQPAPPPAAASPGRGQFIWPTVGQITQGYSAYHSGIDIAPPYGTPIYASNSGVVISIQYLTYDWGWNLVIDHGGGLMTRYAHVSKFLVGQGQQVSRGQAVALVGSTGRSTGPHLHFEVYQNGVRVNPLKFLP